jgi:hypothetical protein
MRFLAYVFCLSVILSGWADTRADGMQIDTLPALSRYEIRATPGRENGIDPPGRGSDSRRQRDVPPDADAKAHFRWSPALREALLFTGGMHGFRFATEPATRDALNGRWWRNYTHSLGELRGWDDGDTFLTSYIAHPFEGAVFGYIAQQNDPRYSQVMWGDGRKYWIGRLRTLAFSAALSTQWSLGPVSEASIGNVQIRDSPGFVDLVGTPIFGTLLMIAEDVADRYLIVGLENRTANKPVLAFARCFLTPTRAFANTLRFKYPWHRDGRMGINGANHELRKELLRAYKEGKGGKIVAYRPPGELSRETTVNYPLEAPIELESSAHYETFLGGGNCIGGGGSGSVRVRPNWQIVSEVSGCLIINMPTQESGDSILYMAGTRWTPRAARRVSPFLQVMVGGRRVTHEIDDKQKRDELMKKWADGHGPIHYPKRSDWSTQRQENGFALSAGGGLDVVINRAFAWRAADLEYTHSWLGNVDQIHAENGLRISSGLILRIGTW